MGSPLRIEYPDAFYHYMVLCTDGCFYGNGMFCLAPLFEVKHMEEMFRHKVFKMLLKKNYP